MKLVYPCGCLRDTNGDPNITDVDELVGMGGHRDQPDRLHVLMAMTCPRCGDHPALGVLGIGGFLHQISLDKGAEVP